MSFATVLVACAMFPQYLTQVQVDGVVELTRDEAFLLLWLGIDSTSCSGDGGMLN